MQRGRFIASQHVICIPCCPASVHTPEVSPALHCVLKLPEKQNVADDKHKKQHIPSFRPHFFHYHFCVVSRKNTCMTKPTGRQRREKKEGLHQDFDFVGLFDHKPCLLQYARAFTLVSVTANSASGASFGKSPLTWRYLPEAISIHSI